MSAHPHAIYAKIKTHTEYDSSRTIVDAKYPLNKIDFLFFTAAGVP